MTLKQQYGAGERTALEAIQRLLIAYCDLLDSGCIEAWADCYTRDGIFEGPNGTVQGREALIAYGNRAKDRGFYLHYLSNVRIDLDTGDASRAAATSYLLYVQRSTAGALTVIGGMQSDALRRESGSWKIEHRKLKAQPLLQVPGATA